MAAGLCGATAAAYGHEVKDLKYGAILFEFYQKKYFEALVEYDYAAERGGIENHGTYPELLKGGVSLSYGLDRQARDIFSRVIEDNAPEEVRNRAWYYLARMLYLRGDVKRSAETLLNIQGAMPQDIDEEYRYLAALVNIRLGYFDEAEAISTGFDKRSSYAPYLYFNLGVAFGKEGDTGRAVNSLGKSMDYADGSDQLGRLADRSNLAIAYLYAEEQDFPGAYEHIRRVNTTGVYSNRALLGAGWASVNEGAYRQALAPLNVLERRAMAIPEVQEAVLLVPHVYEKQGLIGRAAEGFILAYDRYTSALTQLDVARDKLGNADVLELFVRNMDEMLEDSDWFGTAPSVSVDSLSQYMLDLMADHSFQSVLKDLRDLYAIRNNLNGWKRKQDDFDVIIAARAATDRAGRRRGGTDGYAGSHAGLQAQHASLVQRAAALDREERDRVTWLLDDLQTGIDRAGMLVGLLGEGHVESAESRDYARLVSTNMDDLDRELARTNELIGKVEKVMLELIHAELDIHEERMKYYRVQAHLAKARILDRSLASYGEREDGGGVPVASAGNNREVSDAP